MVGNSENYDVIIIGAGPAGTSSALFLNRLGYKVVLLDQSRFPRDKVCGEFISPAADDILEELGVLSSLEAVAPLRLKGVAISSYENPELCIDYPACPEKSRRMTSLSVPRMVLDNLFVERARDSEVEVREEHRVDELIIDDGCVTGVKGRDAAGTPFQISARVVVDAGGRNCISLRQLNLKIEAKGKKKIALAAHWRGAQVPANYCYMHISHPGYTGVAPVQADVANVVLVVDYESLKGEKAEEFYQRTVRGNVLREKIFANATLEERPRTVESLAYSVKEVPCGGLVLVGDAMGFIDPFTGEGIYLSLRSAQLAAGIIDQGFKGKGFARSHLSLYEKLRHKEFHKKFLLSKILQKIIYNPPLSNLVVEVLSRNVSLAQTLVGVIGDYLPADRVVSFRFLGKLLSRAVWSEANMYDQRQVKFNSLTEK